MATPTGTPPVDTPPWYQSWNPMYWWEERAKAIRALEDNPVTSLLSPTGGTEFTLLRLQDKQIASQTIVAIATSAFGVPAITKVLGKLKTIGMALPFFVAAPSGG